MKKQLFGLSFGFVALLLATDIAQAAQCGKRDVVIDRLASHYGETRRAMGLASGNGIIELYASEEDGTWTITVTRPDGITCLLGAGNAFEMTDSIAATGKPA